MPILVSCPKCGVKLNAPDSAAGKKVRCGKAGCGGVVPVPNVLPAEAVEALPPPPPPPPRVAPPPPAPAVAGDSNSVWVEVVSEEEDRPRSKRRRDDDDEDDRPRSKRRRAEEDEEDDRPRKRRRDDDDDDDEDDRPRRKRSAGRGRKRSGTNPGVVVGVVIGLLLLLGGVGWGIYALVAGKASPPKGWKEYTYADAGFKAYFPEEPKKQRGARGPLGQMGGFGAMPAYGVETTENGTRMMMMVSGMPLPPQAPANAMREIMDKALEEKLKTPLPNSRVSGPRSVSWMGERGKELTFEQTDASSGKAGQVTLRIVITDTHMFMAMIGAEEGGKLPSSTINGFFDNIRPLK